MNSDQFFAGDNAENLSDVISAIARSVIHCRFEATDAEVDQVVLMRIVLALQVRLPS